MNARSAPPVKASRGKPDGSTLFLIGLGLLLVLASVLAAFDQVPGLWGLGGFGDSRLWVLVLASLLLLVVLLTPAGRGVGWFFLTVPVPTKGIRPFLVGLAAVPIFFVLRTWSLSGDWRLVLERFCLDLYYPSNLWTNYLFRIVAGPGHALGLLPDGIIALSSALAGGAFVAFLLRLAGVLGTSPAGVRFLFWFTLLTGSSLVFFGAIEVYAALAACLVAFLETVVRVREGRAHPGVAGFTLGVAVCFHGLAALFLPPLLLAVAGWNAGRRVRRVALTLFAFLTPVALAGAVLFLVHWGGAPPQDPAFRYGTFLGAAGQSLITPLSRTPATAAYAYTLSEGRHWIDRINVLFRIAPVALVLALPFLVRRGRRRFPSDPIRADLHDNLRILVGLLLAWMAVHNISFPAAVDWDLFAFIGFPLALFAALAPSPPRPSTAGRILALSLYTTLPWWAASISPPAHLRAASHFALALTYKRIDRPEVEAAFVHHLEACASTGRRPHPEALRMLTVYLASRNRPDAERWLERAVLAYPTDPEFRANLGLWHFKKKNYAAALEHLRASVALEPGNPLYERDLARLLTEIQRFAEAFEHYRNAVTSRPDDKELVLEAIEASRAVNRRREGYAYLERLHGFHPDDPELLRRLVNMSKEVGSLEKMQHYQDKLMAVLRGKQRPEKE